MSDNLLQREAQVLGHGLAEGLTSTVNETWQNLKQAGDDFIHHPVDTTAHYLRDHAKDFVAGAVIGLVAPKKFFAAALAAWSLRGVGVATWGAMSEAADPDADVDALSHKYSRELAHEGTTFLSSMPLTLAGGAFGRAGASAVFGKNMALSDVISGKVTKADIKNNLWELHDSLKPPEVKLVITDLDDTVFPLRPYLVAGLKKNVEMISTKMGLPEAEVIQAIGPQRIHPWVLEQSELATKFKGTPQQFTEQIVKPFWQNMDQARVENLRAFPGAIDTLAELNRRDIKVAALTNAPVTLAVKRVTGAKIEPYLDRVYTMETPEPSISQVVSPQSLEHGRMQVTAAEEMGKSLRGVTELPQEYQKPDARGFEQVLHDYGLRPKQVLAIGDNLRGDGAGPKSLGIPYIWAKYGKEVPLEYQEFLARFKVSAPENAVSGASTSTPPPTIADASQYSDLLQFLKPGINLRAVARDYLQLPRAQSALGFDTISSNISGLPTIDKAEAPGQKQG